MERLDLLLCVTKRPEEWVVEARHYRDEHEPIIAVFRGPNARQLAINYSEWLAQHDEALEEV